MVSILIPVYNYSCLPLVEALHAEVEANGLDVEIIVAEDGSDEANKVVNRPISKIPGCSYVEYLSNKGRSKIRNLLADMSKGDWLLFMDCDAGVCNEHFIGNYIEACRNNQGVDVFCGGLEAPVVEDLKPISLRYQYTILREKRSAHQRNAHPYKAFVSFNFMISRKAFEKVHFDESMVEYGHEDTLFGKSLRDGGFKVMHIDNPLYHYGLERNEVFMKKTEKSIESLYVFRDKLSDVSRLYIAFDSIRRKHCLWMLGLCWNMFGKKMRRKLLDSSHPSMFMFDLYKLCYLASVTLRK